MFSLNPTFSLTMGKTSAGENVSLAPRGIAIEPVSECRIELLLMLVAIVMLSSAVLVYAARH